MENKTQTAATNIISQMKELVEIKDSFKADQLTFVKNLVNPDLTDNELYMFLVYSNRAGLNPFNKEIIAVVYSKNDPSKRRVSIIVARDGKRAVGERKGGIESITTLPIYVKEAEVQINATSEEGGKKKLTKMVKVEPWEGGALWGATSTVVRNGKTFTATVPFKEYDTNQNLWLTKKETMIKKVAESQALSMAIPELLGTYDEAELPSSEAVNLPAQIPVTANDDQDATDAQKATIRAIAKKKGIEIDDLDTWTQAAAKSWIAQANQK